MHYAPRCTHSAHQNCPNCGMDLVKRCASLRSLARILAKQLEVFEQQGSDKTEALRLYDQFVSENGWD